MDEVDQVIHLDFETDLLFILNKLPSDMLEGEESDIQENAMDRVIRGTRAARG